MAGRTIVVESKSKIGFSNGYFVVKSEEGNKEIFLDDFDAVIFSELQTTCTAFLLQALVENGKTVVVCDERRFPSSIILPLCGIKSGYKKLKEQMLWKDSEKSICWKKIVEDKIKSQQQILMGYDIKVVHFDDVKNGDAGNAEGRFADLYFKKMFGADFRRHAKDNINSGLNYGYTILLSSMARIVASHGYMNQIGIHHKGENNPFNLACDFVEPFRPIVDDIVKLKNGIPLDKEYRAELIRAQYREVSYNGKRMSLVNAMEEYFLNGMHFFLNGVISEGELVLL